MLRFVVGDSVFYKILREYAKNFAYGNANTEDFKLVCETIYGGDLDWFFKEWIYEAGYPIYQFGWGVSSQNTVRIIINQIQKGFPIFEMPIEIRFIFPSKIVDKTLWVDKEINIFDLKFEERPLNVIFDPNNWILCRVEKYYKKGRGRR